MRAELTAETGAQFVGDKVGTKNVGLGNVGEGDGAVMAQAALVIRQLAVMVIVAVEASVQTQGLAFVQ